MDLRSMRSRNRMEVMAEKNTAHFLQARTRCAALAQHETVRSVLYALADESPEEYPHRDAITRILINELRRERHPLWLAMLQLAYYPMLSNLRHRIRGLVLPDDELDQVVISSFLEVLETVPIGPETDRICMRLHQGTKRRMFRVVQEEQRFRERFYLRGHQDINWLAEQAYPAEGEDPTEHHQRCLWPETKPTPDPPMDLGDYARQMAFLELHASSAVSRNGLDLVIATLVYGEKLTDIARRMSIGVPPSEHARLYGRLKRRHSRSIARLRVEMAHLRPDTGADRVAPATGGDLRAGREKRLRAGRVSSGTM